MNEELEIRNMNAGASMNALIASLEGWEYSGGLWYYDNEHALVEPPDYSGDVRVALRLAEKYHTVMSWNNGWMATNGSDGWCSEYIVATADTLALAICRVVLLINLHKDR